MVDMIINGVMDARQPLLVARFNDDPESKLRSFADGQFPKFLDALERTMESHGSIYSAGGDKPTVADLMVLELVDYACDELLTIGLDGEKIVNDRPRVAALVNDVGSQARISAYLASDRRKPTPGSCFVDNVTDILDIPKPKWLMEEIQAKSKTVTS